MLGEFRQERFLLRADPAAQQRAQGHRVVAEPASRFPLVRVRAWPPQPLFFLTDDAPFGVTHFFLDLPGANLLDGATLRQHLHHGARAFGDGLGSNDRFVLVNWFGNHFLGIVLLDVLVVPQIGRKRIAFRAVFALHCRQQCAHGAIDGTGVWIVRLGGGISRGLRCVGCFSGRLGREGQRERQNKQEAGQREATHVRVSFPFLAKSGADGRKN